MKYVLLFVETEQFEKDWEAMSPAVRSWRYVQSWRYLRWRHDAIRADLLET